MGLPLLGETLALLKDGACCLVVLGITRKRLALVVLRGKTATAAMQTALNPPPPLITGNSFGAERTERYGPLWKTNILGGEQQLANSPRRLLYCSLTATQPHIRLWIHTHPIQTPPHHTQPAPTIMVYDDASVKSTLSSDTTRVDVWWPDGTAQLVGPASLNVLPQPRQQQVKALFLKAFGERAVLEAYLPAVVRAAAAVLDGWAGAGGGAGVGAEGGAAAAAAALGELPRSGRALPLCEVLASATFHAALLGCVHETVGEAEAAAGPAEIVSQAVERSALAVALAGGFVPPMVDLPFTAFGRARGARRELLSHYASALAAARKRQQAAPAAFPQQAAAAAAIDALVQPSSAAASEEELLDGIMACLFGNAGAGPTALKLFQYLSPTADASAAANTSGAWWARLRAEQRRAVAQHGPRLTAAALSSMPLAEATVREVLRITPVVPAMFRVATSEFELGGRRVPKGWRVWCHTGAGVLRYNRDEFDPSRWLAADASASGGGASGSSTGGSGGGEPSQPGGGACPFGAAAAEGGTPFGLGARACVGRPLMMAQLTALLALLVRRYTWQTAIGDAEPWSVVPAPRPKEGLAGFRLAQVAEADAIPFELLQW